MSSFLRASAALLLLSACATAGAPAKAPPVVETVAPRPEDVGSVDGVLKAFYEVTNIAPGAPRQWARDRTLYVPWIHFVSIHDGKDGPEVTSWTHPEFVAATEPLLKAGFQERELKRRVSRYGNIAHVESSYETRSGTDNPKVSRGVNFLELFFDGTRWWVASAVWQGESPRTPIPSELLP